MVVAGRVTVEEGCFIGINSAIRDHVTLSRNKLVGAGGLILKNTKNSEFYKGFKSLPSVISSDEVDL